MEPHLDRVVPYLEFPVTVFTHLAASRCAQPGPVLTMTEPDPVGVGPGDSRPAVTRRALEFSTVEEAALVAGDAAELPPLTRLRMLRLRARTLIVADEGTDPTGPQRR